MGKKRLLFIGLTGNDVRRVQAGLIMSVQKCPLLKIDGIFGNITRSQVIQFQRQSRLVPDGIVGDKTRAALFPPDEALKQGLINQLALEDFIFRCSLSGTNPDQSDPELRGKLQAQLRTDAKGASDEIIRLVFDTDF